MNIMNTSQYPDAAIRILVKFVAKELEISDFVDEVEVTSCKWAYRGRCWGRRILIRIGSPEKFPLAERQYRKHAPAYSLADWLEAFVTIAGHEFQHARQFRAEHLRRLRGFQDPRFAGAPRRKPFSEVEAERGAFAMLTLFRERREELVQQIAAAVLSDQGREKARKEERAKKNTPEAKRAAKLEAARAALAKWETKRKRAETAIKKYGATVRRLERAETAGKTSVTLLSIRS